MHKSKTVFVVIFSVILSAVFSIPIYAISSNLVISQVQTRSLIGGSASEELIEMYNNSDIDTDITNWCLKYGSSGIFIPTKSLTCFNHSEPSEYNKVFIPKRSSTVLVSKVFNEAYPSFGFDAIFPSGISDTGRWVSLYDGNNLIIDSVEWGTIGTSITTEGGVAAVLPTATQLIQRKSLKPGELIDTDNNLNDFELANARTVYSYGSIYEYTAVDVCTNIDGLQSIIPDEYEIDDGGSCVQIVNDVCINIDGIQEIIPVGYYQELDESCMMIISPIIVSELLPNAAGIDDGNEFIELYNPNDFMVELSKYILYIGNTKYNFPVSSTIEPKQYKSFLNNEIRFTLVNTISNVALYTIDNQLVFETPPYVNPDEGISWSLINSVWQYTNQPTSGLENIVSTINSKVETINIITEMAACAANQYRSLETGHCRLLPTSNLTPCKDGQYRSEETNRCRNIISDTITLVPCAAGQERNPETNRCRSVTAVLGTSDLAPCKEGQERNPETNRCRNINGAMPSANYAPEQTNENSNNYILWWSLLGVALVAISYGLWEWRKELIELFKKLSSIVKHSK